MSDARVANIGPGGRRQRLLMGAISVAVGLAAVVVIAATGASKGFIFLAFVPFWVGALGLIQARERT